MQNQLNILCFSMSYIGKAQGFGQRFQLPAPSAYLKSLAPYALEYERSPISLPLIRSEMKAFRSNGQDLSNDPIMRVAINKAFQAFRLPQPVKMLHLNDVFRQDLPIWSASPGLPWTHFGIFKKSEIRDNVEHVNRVRTFWHKIKMGEKMQLPDCCAFVRSHIVKKGETKVRCVWGYPATVTFGEAVFALPLIRAYMKGGYPVAYGYETGNGGARKLIRDVKGEFYTALDFKDFDKTVPAWLIHAAFDILLMQMDFVEYQDYGVARCDSMLRMWDTIVDYFINTPIRMCNGERYRKKAGIASGSYFTQLIGSIVNYILITYCSLKLGFRITGLRVFGDVSVFGSVTRVPIDGVAEILELIGMQLNIIKSGSSKNINDLTFLGYQLVQFVQNTVVLLK